VVRNARNIQVVYDLLGKRLAKKANGNSQAGTARTLQGLLKVSSRRGAVLGKVPDLWWVLCKRREREELPDMSRRRSGVND
jgi:hypothetical protein